MNYLSSNVLNKLKNYLKTKEDFSIYVREVVDESLLPYNYSNGDYDIDFDY